MRHRPIRAAVVVVLITYGISGCGFRGLNSLPLPGTQERRGSSAFHVEISNVAMLESNSPVLVDDVVVGTVGEMRLRNWHADVEVFVRPEVVVPANAVASVGQTSLLGSMHLSLDPPIGVAPQGRLQPGTTIPLNRSSTYPSTERTLSTLSAVVNGGGLGQIGDVIRNANTAFTGRQSQIRDMLRRLDDFVGTLDSERSDLIDMIRQLNTFTGTFAQQRDDVTAALRRVPAALDVLIRERPRIVTALDKLRKFSESTTDLITVTQSDLVTNLHNLEPTIKALADVGPELDTALAFATTYPYNQSYIDRAVRGDYVNMFLVADLTIPRLKRTMFLGTRWGDQDAKLVPAPGEPWYLNYTYDPLKTGIADPAPATPQPVPTPSGGG
ncbi:MCE family protein [Mycolicibacterium rhodesiae]|uniref:Mammalian cell entry protein n=1 Tax=Mycolicibacterium rhodesiae TaxID=36814 RepID=A0A1X0ILB4_MYCRH|nr:MCE family protein [Mycolicibacterium rhodesiae]MCV7347030.1 MCE family protein [Mycolicibacterium rhodesiae]ORB48296.1 mammalian cell entry protein [Mycolicibacterium rhodesiae]